MTGQLITPELRRWIIEQAEAGHGADTVLAAMMASGWEEGVALSALEEVMVERVSQTQAGTGRVPDVVAEGVSEVWAHDKSVKILVQMKNPRVVVLGDFLSLQECQELIGLAQPRMTRSQTVVNATGGQRGQRGENQPGHVLWPGRK